MATQAERIKLLTDAIGADIKALKASDGDLTSLTTTEKTSLVGAINEVLATTSSGGVQIDDLAGAGDVTVAWSASRILAAITEAQSAIKDELLGGSGAALDTLKELADALDNNPNFATELATTMSKRLRVDAVQTFTTLEKKQGAENLGLGNPDFDFVAAYNTAKA